MTNTFRAQLIATLITANCDAYHAGTVSRAAWDAEQRRLWTLAERSAKLAHAVKSLVAPKLLPVPSHETRKALRAVTLAVGR